MGSTNAVGVVALQDTSTLLEQFPVEEEEKRNGVWSIMHY